MKEGGEIATQRGTTRGGGLVFGLAPPTVFGAFGGMFGLGLDRLGVLDL